MRPKKQQEKKIVPDKPRVLIGENHEIVRLGIRCLLEGTRYEVCGVAEDGVTAVEMVLKLTPDFIILDATMPLTNGITAARQIRKKLSTAKILILMEYGSDKQYEELLEAGVQAVIHKSDPARDIVRALDEISRDGHFITGRAHTSFLRAKYDPKWMTLSPRELGIVQLIAEGKYTKEAAVMLDLAVATVESHRANIMRKLGLHSAAELVLYAVRNRIVDVQLEDSATTQLGNRVWFDFPDSVRAACQQYLTHFAEFLKNLGIQADVQLEERASQTLFTVTPVDSKQALHAIRDALEVYLKTP